MSKIVFGMAMQAVVAGTLDFLGVIVLSVGQQLTAAGLLLLFAVIIYFLEKE